MNSTAPKITFYRQKLLLALLQSFGGKVANIDFQKYLFLFTRTCEGNKSYEFVPHKYGCFSFQSYADRKKLADIGVITNSTEFWQLSTQQDHLGQLPRDVRNKLASFRNRYACMKGDNLVREVYSRYPYYSIRSEIAEKLMSPAELQAISQAKPTQSDICLFTIGYEGKSFEHYLNQLIQNNVHVLCDVRRNPLSRKYGFSKGVLGETLARLGIGYIHLPELGIASADRKALKTQADYDRLFDRYELDTLAESPQALDQLVGLVGQRRRVAITCFESSQCMCHRGRIARALGRRADWEYSIKHL